MQAILHLIQQIEPFKFLDLVAYRKTSRVARHFLDSRAIIIYEGANEGIELKMASQILGEDYRAY